MNCVVQEDDKKANNRIIYSIITKIGIPRVIS